MFAWIILLLLITLTSDMLGLPRVTGASHSVLDGVLTVVFLFFVISLFLEGRLGPFTPRDRD